MSHGAVDVSILILNWDSPEYTQECLRAIERTCSRGDSTYEVLLVDQGSTDSVVEDLKSQTKSMPSVKLIEAGWNRGFSGGNILALHHACPDSRYVCLMNCDVRVTESGWLDTLVGVLEGAPQLAIVGPQAMRTKVEGDSLGDGRLATQSEIGEGTFEFIRGCLCLIRRSLIDELGFLDEAFHPAYFEDTDMNMRYVRAGYGLHVVPIEFEHEYAGPKVFRQKRALLEEQYGDFYARNKALFIQRWYPHLSDKVSQLPRKTVFR